MLKNAVVKLVAFKVLQKWYGMLVYLHEYLYLLVLLIEEQYKTELLVPPIAKRTKCKNRMQITEFRASLSEHKRFLREIQGM